MPNIIIICTANQFRSPLAAAYLLSKLQSKDISDSWKISSAGTWAKEGLPAHFKAIELADEYHLDLRFHRTREINSEILTDADLVLVMEQGQKESLCFEFPHARQKILLLSQISNKYAGDIPDPASNNFEEARLIANRIIKTIDSNFEKIIELSLLGTGSIT